MLNKTFSYKFKYYTRVRFIVKVFSRAFLKKKKIACKIDWTYIERSKIGESITSCGLTSGLTSVWKKSYRIKFHLFF